MLVDKHANRRNRPPEYVQESFYGQLLHILMVHLPAALELHPCLSKSSTYLLAAVHQCEVTQKGPLKTPIYSKMGRTEVIDINCVQCRFSVLGRGLGPSQAVAWAYQGSRLGLQLLEA